MMFPWLMSTPVVYNYVLPKVWEYLQKNIINVGNATLGSTCFNIHEGKATDISDIILNAPSKQVWSVDSKSTTLIIELFAKSTVKKILVQSDSFSPSAITIEYSANGTKNSFRPLKVVTRDQLRKVPFSIDLNKSVEAKFIRFKISTDAQKVSLSKIEIYGSPLITLENLSSIEYSKALNTLYKKFIVNDTPLTAQQQGDEDHQESTVTFEEVDSDDDEDVAEVRKEEKQQPFLKSKL
ncbi:tyrosinase [Acrasis kona]|uniref:Tyrosinase n=1 Tax=Acrasis kona TaxID=1008807 RepID=A0AAW2YXZ8_9EUKA